MSWEIRRAPKPLGVRLYDDSFKSYEAAKLAGEKALHALMESLTTGAPEK
jgi:hypothetical protein